MSEQEKLRKFAEMFEKKHKAIQRSGSTCIDEYDEIWHYYRDEVLPIIEKGE